MTTSDQPYVTTKRLDVPADVAWRILASRAGTRLWFDDPQHPGLRPGALVPVRGSKPAEIDSVVPDETMSLLFADGRYATVAVRADGDRCELVVTDHGGDGRATDALSDGWDGLLTAAKFLVDQTKAKRRPRQAVVVIHGIGNQRPMATIGRFTDALVERGEQLSKPDQVSRSYELHRYQLRRKRYRPRTDIYELYWADKMPGTRQRQITSWLRSLLLRDPRHLNARLRPIAYLTYGVLLATAVAIAALVGTLGFHRFDQLWPNASALAKVGWVSLLISIVGSVVNGFLVSTLGDAARYLDAAPDNIAVRQAIRESGVALLRRLHDEGQYDRVVVVGHSLGSVIGYDIIRQYWLEVYHRHGAPPVVDQTALASYEKQLAQPITDVERYRKAQRDVWREYRRLGLPWLVTDLVTLGSPLTYVDTLHARSPDDLRTRIGQLELPACPPHCGSSKLAVSEKYLVDGQIRSMRMLTSGAPFALIRWTNLYFPTRGIVFGDPVGGPVAPMLGAGIKDVPVTTKSWFRRRTPLAHTAYWRRPSARNDASPSRELLEAVGIESGRWLGQHVDEVPWELSIIQARDH